MVGFTRQSWWKCSAVIHDIIIVQLACGCVKWRVAVSFRLSESLSVVCSCNLPVVVEGCRSSKVVVCQRVELMWSMCKVTMASFLAVAVGEVSAKFCVVQLSPWVNVCWLDVVV